MTENDAKTPETEAIAKEKTALQDTEAKQLKYARKRVLQYKLFYVHALIYAAVNSLLLLIDVLTGNGLWFYWALFGWGIGLGLHAALIWGMPRIQAWEDKMVEHEMSRQNQ